MRADLHMHSTYSDGLCSPDELCALAKANGVELLSITDHDTMNGADIKLQSAKKYGLRYVHGWEISAYQSGEQIHVLGYGCQQNDAYLAFMQQRKDMAWLRAQERVDKLRALGIPITMEQVTSFRQDPATPIHTMHVARAAAVLMGIRDSQVYVEYLARGKVAYSEIGRPTPQEAIVCIHECGGLAVMAHPGRIHGSAIEQETWVERLAEYGVDGIEAVYTTHTAKEVETFKALAKKHGLFITGGSDTHIQDETHTIGHPVFLADEDFLEKFSSIIL
jgi:predicted metal-dependent phosphoesterase TrpH